MPWGQTIKVDRSRFLKQMPETTPLEWTPEAVIEFEMTRDIPSVKCNRKDVANLVQVQCDSGGKLKD